jgi:hypothetical protein
MARARRALPFYVLQARQTPIKQPYGHFRGGRLRVGWPAAVLLPPWIRLYKFQANGFGKRKKKKKKKKIAVPQVSRMKKMFSRLS